jgi:hypothetical protein
MKTPDNLQFQQKEAKSSSGCSHYGDTCRQRKGQASVSMKIDSS